MQNKISYEMKIPTKDVQVDLIENSRKITWLVPNLESEDLVGTDQVHLRIAGNHEVPDKKQFYLRTQASLAIRKGSTEHRV